MSETADGFYGIYYTGHAGSSFGLLVLMNKTIVGIDAAGGRYDGSFEDADGCIKGKISLQVPAGIPLVTGGGVGPLTMEIPVELTLPIKEDNPQEIRTPAGPVNVNFRKLRNF